MRIIILTSSDYGTAAHLLPYLIESKICDITGVILSEGLIPDTKKHYKKKLKKLFQIGVPGALNGIRMRKWYHEDVNENLKIRSLADICREHHIPFHKTPMINGKETMALFEKAGADLGLSLGNGYIGKKIFTIPKLGMLNIHHEMLPEYQNAQSVIWQLYNMSDKTGYTIHKIDHKIDTGAIIYQEQVPIQFMDTLHETVVSTYSLLLEASAKGLVHVIRHFDTLEKQVKPQGRGNTYTTPGIFQFLRICRNFRKLKKAVSMRS